MDKIWEALKYALMGYGTVFLVLLVLMALLVALTAIIRNATKTKQEAKDPFSREEPGVPPVLPPAGAALPPSMSAGDICLHDVDDKTAAILMAIVANRLGAPLNQLRFISIKEKV